MPASTQGIPQGFIVLHECSRQSQPDRRSLTCDAATTNEHGCIYLTGQFGVIQGTNKYFVVANTWEIVLDILIINYDVT